MSTFTTRFFCWFLLLLFGGIGPRAQAGKAKPELFPAAPAVHTITLVGYTRPRRVMELVSKESGFCSEVRGEIGDPIGPSGVFAVLDTTFIDNDVLQNRVRQRQLTSRIGYYQKERDRHRRLVQSGNLDQSSLDRLDNQLDEARHELEKTRLQEQDLLERRETFQIKSRPGWKIISRRVEPGEWVVAGRSLGQAGDFRTLLVPFALSFEEFQALRSENERITLLLSHSNQSVPAHIARVSPDFDPKTRKIQVELGITSEAFLHRGGIRTELALTLADLSGAVLVPESALVKSYEEFGLIRPDGRRVKVMYLGQGPDGTVRVSSPLIQAGEQFKRKPRAD